MSKNDISLFRGGLTYMYVYKKIPTMIGIISVPAAVPFQGTAIVVLLHHTLKHMAVYIPLNKNRHSEDVRHEYLKNLASIILISLYTSSKKSSFRRYEVRISEESHLSQILLLHISHFNKLSMTYITTLQSQS